MSALQKIELKKGDKTQKDRVILLQKRLQELGYNQPLFGVDGIPGKEFFATIACFCVDYRLISIVEKQPPKRVNSLVVKLNLGILPIEIDNLILNTNLPVFDRGVDISQYQGRIDYKALATSGIRFAYIRGSIGENGFDKDFKANAARIKEGLSSFPENVFSWGLYHLWKQKSDPIGQADHLIRIVNETKKSSLFFDLIPALDVEGNLDVLPEQANERLKKTIDKIEQELGCKPLIYTSARICKEWDLVVGGGCPAWLVGWKMTKLSEIKTEQKDSIVLNYPEIPHQWKDWTVWQTGFGGEAFGAISGVLGDIDRDLIRRGGIKDIYIVNL